MTGGAITNPAQLHDLLGEPRQSAVDKGADSLDRYARLFLSLCPFICIGTSDAAGIATVSPRGDPPGFVTVLDDRTILIPDRPGNRRVDTMRNILANPRLGIVAFLPGVGETLRISGRGSIVTDAELLEGSVVSGRAPKVGVRVEIDDVYFHCAKAIIRSDLWGGRYLVDRTQFPSFAEILRGQRGGELDSIQADLDESYQNRLY